MTGPIARAARPGGYGDELPGRIHDRLSLRAGITCCWGVARPRFPGGGPACLASSAGNSLAGSARTQVQDDDLVGAGACVVVTAGGLSRLVRVRLRRPADPVLRVVLEPVRRRGDRDDRQVRLDVLLDRRERGGLRGDRGGPRQLGQRGVDGRVLQPLVVAGGGGAAGQRAVQPVVVQVVGGDAVVGPVL